MRCEVVILNMFDVMLAATHVVPRVETTLYTGWSSSKTGTFLQPIILDNIVNFYKGKVRPPATRPRSHSTLSPVNTGMGDRLRTRKLP